MRSCSPKAARSASACLDPASRGRAGPRRLRTRSGAGVSRPRLDQPAHRHERDQRVGGGTLGARLRAQHRDDVVDVEAREQEVDETAGALGVERAHLLQRAAPVHPDRRVEPPERIAGAGCLDVAAVRGAVEGREQRIAAPADQTLIVRVAEEVATAGAQDARCRRRSRRGRRTSSHTGACRLEGCREPLREPTAQQELGIGEPLLDRVPDGATVVARQLDAAPRVERRIDVESAGERRREVEVATVDAQPARARAGRPALGEQRAEELRVPGSLPQRRRARRGCRRAARRTPPPAPPRVPEGVQPCEGARPLGLGARLPPPLSPTARPRASLACAPSLLGRSPSLRLRRLAVSPRALGGCVRLDRPQ